MMALPNWKRRWYLLALLGAIALALAWFIWFISSGRRFEPSAWVDERLVQDGARLEMADDIINRKLLDGKTRSEVIALLGQPPETGYFRDWHLVYWLGPERGLFSIDSEWFVVRFGKNERVTEYQLVRD